MLSVAANASRRLAILALCVALVTAGITIRPEPAEAFAPAVPVILGAAALLVILACAQGVQGYDNLAEAADANDLSYKEAAYYHAAFKQFCRDHNLLGQPQIQAIIASFVGIYILAQYIANTPGAASAWSDSLADAKIEGTTAWVPMQKSLPYMGIHGGYTDAGWGLTATALGNGLGWAGWEDPRAPRFSSLDDVVRYERASPQERKEWPTYRMSGSFDTFDSYTEATSWNTGGKYDRQHQTPRITATNITIVTGGAVTADIAQNMEDMIAASFYYSAVPIGVAPLFDCSGSLVSNTVKITGIQLWGEGWAGSTTLADTLNFDTVSNTWDTLTIPNSVAASALTAMNNTWGAGWHEPTNSAAVLTRPSRLAYAVTPPKAVPIHKDLAAGTAAQQKAAAEAITNGLPATGANTYDPSGAVTGPAVTLPGTVDTAIASPGAGLGDWVLPWCRSLEGAAQGINNYAQSLHDLPAGFGEVVQTLVMPSVWALKALAVVLAWYGGFLEAMGMLMVRWWTWAWAHTAATWTTLSTTIGNSISDALDWSGGVTDGIDAWWTDVQTWWAARIAVIVAAIEALGSLVDFTAAPPWMQNTWNTITAPFIGAAHALEAMLWPFETVAEVDN